MYLRYVFALCTCAFVFALLVLGVKAQKQSRLLSRTGYAPHRQIEPSALGEQGRCLRIDAVDAVKGQARIASKHEHIAGIEAERAGRIASLAAADAEQTRIAQRQRYDRCRKIGFVAILM